MRRFLFLVLAVLMVVAVGCEVKILFSEEFGFEDDGGRWEVWLDPDPAGTSPWQFTKNSQYARSGNYALEAFFDPQAADRPYSVWIERPLELLSYAPVRVKIRFSLVVPEGESVFWNVWAYAGTRHAESIYDFEMLSTSGDPQKWQVYQYERELELDQGGVLWVAIGIELQHTTRFRGYIDDISIEVAGPTDLNLGQQSGSLGSRFGIENLILDEAVTGQRRKAVLHEQISI